MKKSIMVFLIVAIIVLIITSIYFVRKYCLETWIFYGANNPISMSDVLRYNITVTRTGTIIGNNKKEKLTKNELKELKELVKLMENSNILDPDYDPYNGLYINGKEYVIDEHNSDAYNKILKIIK